mmetsp:Transcript_44628/g.94968  ORF Transcript_44628/g.94968 Transcript_44628/m.94968 type:complete len:124 (+) Transcript_44628:443-814(+)
MGMSVDPAACREKSSIGGGMESPIHHMSADPISAERVRTTNNRDAKTAIPTVEAVLCVVCLARGGTAASGTLPVLDTIVSAVLVCFIGLYCYFVSIAPMTTNYENTSIIFYCSGVVADCFDRF